MRYNLRKAMHESLLARFLVPVCGILIVALCLLVGFSGSRVNDQERTIAQASAEGALELLRESLEYSMAHGQKDFDPLMRRLSEANCFVLPSFIENSPNSLCEAMLLGLPCVASCVA